MMIQEFKVTTKDSSPYSIVLGEDQSFWFTQNKGNKIGKISRDGSISEFTVPAKNAGLSIITIGENELWFTEMAMDKVAKIGYNGNIEEFRIPNKNCGVYELLITILINLSGLHNLMQIKSAGWTTLKSTLNLPYLSLIHIQVLSPLIIMGIFGLHLIKQTPLEK